MDFRRLKYFIVSVEIGSLRQAAIHLGISQPTLSRQIQILEREIGAQLLTRERQRVRLTQAGTVVLKSGKEILQRTQSIQDQVRAIQSEADSGRLLTIGIIQTFMEDILARALTSWRKGHDRVIVRIQGNNTTEITDMVRNGIADFGIVALPFRSENLQWRTLGTERFVGVVSPRDKWAGIPKTEFTRFIDSPLITMRESLPIRDIVSTAAEAAGTKMQIQMELDSLDAIRALIRSGQGRAILPISAVRRDAQAGNLAVIELEWLRGVKLQRTIAAVYRAQFPPSRKSWRLMAQITLTAAATGVLDRHRAKPLSSDA